MINFRGSPAIEPFEECREAPRRRNEDNEQWLKRTITTLQKARPKLDDPATYVVLLGGVRTYDYRLRIAQSHLRSDVTPSHWSHVFMFASTDDGVAGDSEILEASLEPYEGFQVPSKFNGLQWAPLLRYRSPDYYPNIAVIRVPVPPAAWCESQRGQKSIVTQFTDQRVVLDVTSLYLLWLGFVWCACDAGNPLLSGQGVPSAAVIESLIGSCGYDMSPGLDAAASSPEAFWQTAKWWQQYFADLKIAQMLTRYHIATRSGDAEEAMPAQPVRSSARGTTKKSASTTAKKSAQRSRRASRLEREDLAARGLANVLPQPALDLRGSMTARRFIREP